MQKPPVINNSNFGSRLWKHELDARIQRLMERIRKAPCPQISQINADKKTEELT